MPIYARTISALEKCFMDEKIEWKPILERGEALRGEEYSFEIAYTTDEIKHYPKREFQITIESPLKDYITMRTVEQIPVRMPCYFDADDNYLRKTPGLYPDTLRPINSSNTAYFTYGELKSFYVTVDVPVDAAPGDYPIKVTFDKEYEGIYSTSVEFTLHVIDAVLPEQEMKVTEWFHSDCIANYYDLEVFSDKHFEYIGKFMKCAVKNGINMILMPIFTPPLDTAWGGERLTTQLVGVRETEEGWQFDFTLLRRWVELAKECGVKYHEIAHFYSQWGAARAPKIMGYDKSGEFKRLFGWETEALSDEYRGFLRALIPAMLEEFKALGIDKDCVFHISDEPALEHLEHYTKAREQVADLLEGYVIMDALSDFEFYKTGALPNPIPSNDHIVPFIEAGVENLWTYYCCGQGKDVSNRFLAMPMARTRIMGAQMWKYKIAGFLQWGFNFYSSQNSVDPINPFMGADNDYFVPAGDTYAVLPGPHGEPWETLHMKGFTMALQDMRAMYLAEKLSSREEVMAILESEGEVTFAKYPHSAAWLLEMRGKINRIIENAAANK